MNQTAAATELPHKRFVRRASLTSGEMRCNFRQVDNDALRVVRSSHARKVTNLMMHIYISLVDAPFRFRDNDGELYFSGESRDGTHITAWEQLTELLEVADGTALKALRWMHEQGVIGYCARKNGAGIRIFINRAVASIKATGAGVVAAEQKNLPATLIANDAARVSPNAMPFKAELRKKEDTKINTFAPQSCADNNPSIEVFDETISDASATVIRTAQLPAMSIQPQSVNRASSLIPANIVAQICEALEPKLSKIAAQSAARESAREAEKTRQWLDSYGLPKAARVAQREAYNVFKHQHAKTASAERARADLQVGQSTITYSPPHLRSLTTSEINEIAEACVTMLEVQSKAIDETLAEMSAARGGPITTDDVPKVREVAHALMLARSDNITSQISAYDMQTPHRTTIVT